MNNDEENISKIIEEELDKNFENFLEDLDKSIEEDEELLKESEDIFSKEDKKESYETFLKYNPDLRDLK